MRDLIFLRQAICRELETISHYQELVAQVQDPVLQGLFEHAMNEEKAHVAEFLQHLCRLDPQQEAPFSRHDFPPHAAKPLAWTVGSLFGRT